MLVTKSKILQSFCFFNKAQRSPTRFSIYITHLNNRLFAHIVVTKHAKYFRQADKANDDYLFMQKTLCRILIITEDHQFKTHSFTLVSNHEGEMSASTD